MLVELTHEERAALKELCEVRSTGKSVKEFINHRLYTELSHVLPDPHNEQVRVEHPGFTEQRQAYEGLVKKGLLEGSEPRAKFSWFGDLTSAGRCYFADEKTAKETERKKIKSDRAHDYRLALFSIVSGGIAGALVSIALHLLFGI